MALSLPDGTPTTEFLVVRGIDSDEFKLAELQGQRKALEVATITDEGERAAATRALENEVLAALIPSWSFPEECNFDNVVTFLTEAPQVADRVNKFAANRKDFFAPASLPSKPGTKRKSPSPKK